MINAGRLRHIQMHGMNVSCITHSLWLMHLDQFDIEQEINCWAEIEVLKLFHDIDPLSQALQYIDYMDCI